MCKIMSSNILLKFAKCLKREDFILPFSSFTTKYSTPLSVDSLCLQGSRCAVSLLYQDMLFLCCIKMCCFSVVSVLLIITRVFKDIFFQDLITLITRYVRMCIF